jgi:hypothetical protein
MSPLLPTTASLAPSPEHLPCWQFPKGLHGSRSSTHSFSTRIASEGVRHGSWRKLWLELETESIFVLDDPIWVSDRSRFFPSARALWRLNSVHIALREKSFRSGNMTVYETLVSEMSDSLWMCLAISAPHSWHGPWGCDVAGLEWARSVLGALVAWLPEMQYIHLRIANLVSIETATHLWRIPAFRFQWASGILDLCRVLGAVVDIPADQEDERWDLISELCGRGVIVVENGRCQLVV